MNSLAITQILMNSYYDIIYLDKQITLTTDISATQTNTEADNLFNQKGNTSGNNSILGDLTSWGFICLDFKVINNDDFNYLALTQLHPNESIIDLRAQ